MFRIFKLLSEWKDCAQFVYSWWALQLPWVQISSTEQLAHISVSNKASRLIKVSIHTQLSKGVLKVGIRGRLYR